MRVAVTGSSGLIGTAVCAALAGDGHELVRLVRRAAVDSDEAQWDIAAGTVDESRLEKRPEGVRAGLAEDPAVAARAERLDDTARVDRLVVGERHERRRLRRRAFEPRRTVGGRQNERPRGQERMSGVDRSASREHCDLGRGTESVACWKAICIGCSPLYGCSPTSISYSMIPSE